MRRKLYYSPFRFVRKYFMFILILFLIYRGVANLYREYLGLMKATSLIYLPLSIANIPKIVVHFDLKGAPPNIVYLRSVLRDIKDFGANAILLEYEDMFPFEKQIKNLSTPFHYDRGQLVTFLYTAAELDLEVIPLVQTLGNMEFALKLEEFQRLRENPSNPNSLCPSKNGSLELLKNVIDQVIFMHNYLTPLKHIHIGGGEVHQQLCSDCIKRALSHSALCIQHLRSVAKIIKAIVPETKILIWDTMLRRTYISLNFQDELMQLGSEYQIQPVFQDYTANLSGLSQEHMLLYQKAFKSMWVASAYKGAEGSEAVTPDLKKRLLNNLNWLKFMLKYKKLYNFNGIILTGRSRYGHFQPICELLPTSYRSLATSLLLAKQFKHGFRKNDTKDMYTINDWDLACKTYFDYHFDGLKYRRECSLNSYEVSLLNDDVVALEVALKKNRDFFNIDLEAKIKYCYMDSKEIIELIRKAYNLTSVIKVSRIFLKRSMRYFFDQNVYKEYIVYKSYCPYEDLVIKLNLCLEKLVRTYNSSMFMTTPEIESVISSDLSVTSSELSEEEITKNSSFSFIDLFSHKSLA